MWALVTELLFSFILLAFLVISCQNVLHIASGSVRSVLKYIHTQLDRELGEVEGVSDEEENVATRVVRRRVILKVQRGEARRAELAASPLHQGNQTKWLEVTCHLTRTLHSSELVSCCSRVYRSSPVLFKIRVKAEAGLGSVCLGDSCPATAASL